MYHRVKKHVHILLHPTEGNTRWDKILNGFLITLILLTWWLLSWKQNILFTKSTNSFFTTST